MGRRHAGGSASGKGGERNTAGWREKVGLMQLSGAHSGPPERSEVHGPAEEPSVGAGARAGFRNPPNTCYQVSQEEGRALWKLWFWPLRQCLPKADNGGSLPAVPQPEGAQAASEHLPSDPAISIS